MPTWGRWILAILVVAVVLGGPLAYYRSVYTYQKRFREVTPGKFYRSGQFTASGMRDIVARHGIKTIVNLQEENADPFMPEVWLGKPSVRESELCATLGVKYVPLFGSELLPPAEAAAGRRPEVIDQFLCVIDDPANYPILIHCKAGLHRTGRLTAIYRMEKENRSPAEAMDELRANGYGTYDATTHDENIIQYVKQYKKGVRNCPPPKGGK